MENYVEDITCMSIELLREVCTVTADVCSQVGETFYSFILFVNLLPFLGYSMFL